MRVGVMMSEESNADRDDGMWRVIIETGHQGISM